MRNGLSLAAGCFRQQADLLHRLWLVRARRLGRLSKLANLSVHRLIGAHHHRLRRIAIITARAVPIAPPFALAAVVALPFLTVVAVVTVLAVVAPLAPLLTLAAVIAPFAALAALIATRLAGALPHAIAAVIITMIAPFAALMLARPIVHALLYRALAEARFTTVGQLVAVTVLVLVAISAAGHVRILLLQVCLRRGDDALVMLSVLEVILSLNDVSRGQCITAERRILLSDM
nr:hypothetical protein [Rhodoligotrophos defluvii]